MNSAISLFGFSRRAKRLPALWSLLLACSTACLAAAEPEGSDLWPELDPKLPRQPFAAAAFEDGDGPLRSLSQSQLARWLGPVPGQNHRFAEAQRGNVLVATYEGLVKLKAPWPSDAVLSLAPFEHNGMAIYFWNGTNGVSLHYFQNPRPNWSAYRITRKDTELFPASYALVAADNDVYARSLGGAIEIRHQEGALVMNRGDLHLLTAPLAAPPTEVYFDRRAWLRSLTMYRAEPFPNLDLAARPAAEEAPVQTPAAWDWPIQPASGSTFKRLKEGAVELASTQAAESAWSAVKLPRAGLYEIIFRLGDATPGTGVYLGDDAGKPLWLLSVMRDQKTRQPAIQFQNPGANAFELVADLNQLQAPFIQRGQWLRLIAGSGSIKCWTSGDGQHWSRVLDPWRGIRGSWSHFGLVSNKWTDPRRIVLEHLQIRPLARLTGFADPQLADRVPAAVINGDPNPPAWQARVVETLPPGTDLGPWRAACAVRSLAAIPPAPLGNLILDGMIQDVVESQKPLAQRLEMLNEIAEVYDAWDAADCLRLSQYYEQLAWQAFREGNHTPWTSVARVLLSAPFSTNSPYQTIPDSLATAELLWQIATDDWPQVRDLCRQLRFYNRPGYPEMTWPGSRDRSRLLVDWAVASAVRALGEKPREGQSAPTMPYNWLHPLIVNSSKEGFNTLAELDAALSEQSYKDACQIISSARPDLALGLFPDARDSRLLLSLPQAVELAMRDHPQLRQTMATQFAATGRLRLQQAAADGNPQFIRALAVQFSGTAAAATAQQWLGDRALVLGDFANAEAEYEHALQSAEPDQRPGLTARLRLAAAMLGRDAGEPPRQTVVLETVQLAPEAFERLVAEMKQQALTRGVTSAVSVEAMPRTAVKAARYDVQHRGAPRGDVGENPGNPSSGAVDWVARQIGWTLVKDHLYFSNRFQVQAYHVKSRQPVWTLPVGKEQGPAHGWALTPCRPVVAGERLFVRRLAKANPELICVNATNGQLKWTSKPALNVASDPLLVQDRVYVFSIATPLEDGQVVIDLCQFDMATGDLLLQQPILNLRNLWDRQLSVQAAVIGTRVVGLAGGTVFCCDFSGRTVWVRRQPWIPPTQAVAAAEQSPSLPLAIGKRVFVTQPGVFAVECLDLETGRRLWQTPVPEMRRLLGLTGERLMLETTRGWQALATGDGRVLWQADGAGIADGYVCPTSGDLLVVQREIQQSDVWRPVLIWLNSETGRELARQPLDALADKDPFLGPFVVDQDRLWTLFGRGIRDPHRDLYELVPTNDPAQAPRTAVKFFP
ncbi:MAG: PQQ-like beta-propeller repeat protein [Planctomycetes bacterium]|nr:PQQ-like beta-propeller repeat protein [Planctomycetota bacterium]